MSSTFEAEQLLKKYLNKIQQNKVIMNTLAALIAIIFLYVAGKFVYDMIPRQYTLHITGGDILSQRHLIAKVLEEEAAKEGITLVIHPVAGSVRALEQVNSGQLDLAFIQGGMNLRLENVEHVATVSTETLHLLAKADIQNVRDLRGKTVNVGSKTGGTRIVAHQVMNFVGLQENIDYAETYDSTEDVLAMYPEKLPDAMFVVSPPPSYVVERMVKKQGYHLLEIPFPEALALREGWVSGEKILAYTYNSNPPEPAKDMKSIGVNMHLVANKKTDSKAVAKLMEILYSPKVASKLRMKLDEKNVTIPSGFPISAATETFLKRNEAAFSAKTVENIQKGFGAAMTLLTLGLMMLKWFKGGGLDDNGSFKAYVKKVADIEEELHRRQLSASLDPELLHQFKKQLIEIRIEAMRRYPAAKLTDPTIMDKVINSTNGALQQINVLSATLVSR
ncbi:MAG TPA: TAXI family TRAP transporter solute-binding subunit [Patescibacteria group bacterium]|nr:TAXI family TRAP transporter solute-binding subunit [Patescibacteria group bacterium]